MTNSNLKCSANSCSYNCSGDCFAGGINVDGQQATTTSSTYCSSYQDKATGGFTNSANECDCVGTQNIQCKAYNCKYNDNEACKAENVQINDVNASCETFVNK